MKMEQELLQIEIMKQNYIIPKIELTEVFVSENILTFGSNSVKDFGQGGTITLGADDDNEQSANSMNTSLWEEE